MQIQQIVYCRYAHCSLHIDVDYCLATQFHFLFICRLYEVMLNKDHDNPRQVNSCEQQTCDAFFSELNKKKRHQTNHEVSEIENLFRCFGVRNVRFPFHFVCNAFVQPFKWHTYNWNFLCWWSSLSFLFCCIAVPFKRSHFCDCSSSSNLFAIYMLTVCRHWCDFDDNE